RPRQQLDFDRHESGRPREAETVGLIMYYALLPFAVVGAILLRRRSVSILPLLALVALVVITVAVTFGQTRYRVPAEVTLVLFASVALDAVSTRGRAQLVGSRDQLSEAG